MKVIMTREELKEIKGECSHNYIPIIDWKEHKLVYVHHGRIMPIEIIEEK